MRDSRNLAEIFCYAIICSGVFSDRWEFDNMLSDITKTCLSTACSDVRIPLKAFCNVGLRYDTIRYDTIRYDTISYRIESHRFASYRVVSYRIVSYRIVSYRIVSYRIVSYRIVSLMWIRDGKHSDPESRMTRIPRYWYRVTSRVQDPDPFRFWKFKREDPESWSRIKINLQDPEPNENDTLDPNPHQTKMSDQDLPRSWSESVTLQNRTHICPFKI